MESKRLITVMFVVSIIASIFSGCTSNKIDKNKVNNSSNIITESNFSSEVSEDNVSSESFESVSNDSEFEDLVVKSENEEYKYDKYNDHIEITGYKGTSLKIKLPESIDGLPVTKIYNPNKKNNPLFPHQVVSVEIPDTVTEIGDHAFCLTKVKSVSISNSVEVIGEYAFAGCYNLQNLKLPSNLKKIDCDAFDSCTDADIFGDELIIPPSVTEIGAFAFQYSNLKEIVLPDSITEVPEKAFYRCKQLKKVTLGKNISTIEKCAFADCYSLDKTNFNPGLRKIGNSAFCSCAFSSISLPEGVSLGDQAFYDNDKLTEIVIPKNTSFTLSMNMGNYFGHCGNLTTAKIYSEVVPQSMFWDCPLENVYLSDDVIKISSGSLGYGNGRVCHLHIPASVELIENFTSTPEIFIIYGKKGSEAEKFAKDNEIKFVEE